MATFEGTRDSNLGLTIDNQSRLALTLDTITQFDETVGNFDLPEGNFDLGGPDVTSNPNYYTANIKSSGYYYYDNTLSQDAIYDATFTIVNGMTTENEYDLLIVAEMPVRVETSMMPTHPLMEAGKFRPVQRFK